MPLFNRVQGNPKHPTLVFLHGFLGNVNDWSETINFLKDDYYCVSIDLPGHGHSVSIYPSQDEGFEYCHHLICNALNELNITQFTFVAYSLGGRLALDYARTQDDPRLQRLILESCHTGLINEKEKELRYQHDLGWAQRFATQSMIDTLFEWYDQPVFSSLNDQEKERMIEKRSKNYGVYLASILLLTSLSKQTDALPYLQKNKLLETPLPIYYCFGEKDTKFSQLAETLSAQTSIKVIKFKDSGHNIHQQVPQQYAQIIKEIFKK